VSGRLALGVLAGLGVGGGVLMCVMGARGRDPATQPFARGQRSVPWDRVAAGAAVGLLVLAVTRWLAVAVALGIAAGYWRQLFGGARATRLATDRLEALAGWTESLRDMVATGVALPEALPASLTAASPLLAGPLTGLVDRLRSREPLEAALYAFAAELDDVSADLVVASLLLNSRAQGRQLHAVLTALSRSARQELAIRRAVEAERRATRRGVRIVLSVTVVMALGLKLLNPDYVEPYRTVTGQLVLTLVVAVFIAGFLWLHRLARIPAPRRFLAAPHLPSVGQPEGTAVSTGAAR
jgi:Flp pilus assembly protein TadB